MIRHWGWLVPIVSALAACTGVIGGDGDAGEKVPSTPTDFVCDEELVWQNVPLRRLSFAQYQNTIADLVDFAMPGGAVGAAMMEIEPAFASIPDDLRIGPDKHYAGFTRLDQAVQQSHVDGAYAVAEAVGVALTVDDTRLAEAVGSCATDADTSNDDACVDELIRRFGERALRRAITDEDVAFYKQPAQAPPFEREDYADVIALILNAPHMLYFVEHGTSGSDADRVALTAYELASRLSYHFWQSLPDEELFAAARSGEILTDEGYAAQVDRIFAHPRTDGALRSFFGEWLDNTTLEELDSRVGTPVFDAFAGFVPGPDLRENMLQEVTDAAVYYTTNAGTYGDLLESDRSFAKTDDLASIYGNAVWDGSGEPPAFGDGRSGLVTRAAYVATGSANTRPIMKGVFLRKALLCDEIPAPPANAAANPPMLSEQMSTRDVVEELTGQSPCSGCHQSIINPMGFATENFDALARMRSEQTLYDDSGNVVSSAPIDTTSVPAVDAGDTTASTGAADLTQLIMGSAKPYACFARQYFRFTFGRIEDLDRDACALAVVKQQLDDGESMSQVLRTIAQSRTFRERSFLDE